MGGYSLNSEFAFFAGSWQSEARQGRPIASYKE
jgi:hypothetical protein